MPLIQKFSIASEKLEKAEKIDSLDYSRDSAGLPVGPSSEEKYGRYTRDGVRVLFSPDVQDQLQMEQVQRKLNPQLEKSKLWIDCEIDSLTFTRWRADIIAEDTRAEFRKRYGF